jgi:hypothetical protein
MDDKLQQAYAALQAAHDAGNTADATQLADYITTLQGQQQTTSAAEPSSEVRTGAALPAVGGALGATVGTAAAIGSKGKNIYNAISKMGSAPPVSTGYNPRGSSVEESVQNWRTYADAQNEAAKSVRRDSELHKKYPGFTRPNLPHLQPVVPTTSQNILGHAANLGTNRPLTGLTAGANALDLAQQVRAENPVQATVSGLGLLGSAAPYVKKLPKQLRGAGMAASAAAPVINRLLDKFTNPPEEKEEKAAGGLIQHYDAGSAVKGAKAAKKVVSGFLEHTPSKPNPLVGTRFDVKDLGGIAPSTQKQWEDYLDAMVTLVPYDATHRNKQILGVSGRPLTTEDIFSHGGRDYVNDVEHIQQGIGGASGKAIANRIQKRTDVARDENLRLGGSGQTIMLPSSMGRGGEDFAVPTWQVYYDLFKQAEHNPNAIQQYSDSLRAVSKTNPKTKVTKYPFADMANLDDPKVIEQFLANGDMRKAFIKQQKLKENQRILGVNSEDIRAALTDPNTVNLPRGYVGGNIIETVPGAKTFPSSNITYNTNFAGKPGGHFDTGDIPAAVAMNDPYSNMFAEMQARYPNKPWQQVHDMATGALERRNEGVSQHLNEKAINRIRAYQSGLEEGKFNQGDIKGALDYLNQPGIYGKGIFAEGGSVPHFAGGGDVDNDNIETGFSFSRREQMGKPLTNQELMANLTNSRIVKAAQQQAIPQEQSMLPDVSMDVKTIPNMTGRMPGMGYMQTPQGAMARLQMEKELENAGRIRAGVSGMGMALPGQHGIKLMPGQMDVGYKNQIGPHKFDVGAFRTINPIPGKGHIQGVNTNYRYEFAEGGSVPHLAIGGNPLEAFKKLGLTEKIIEAWKAANKVSQRQTRNPILQQAAIDLGNGKITSEQYRALVREHMPIKPLTEVPQMPSHTDMASALKNNQVETGIVGVNKEIPHGTRVSSRLDIPAYDNYDQWIVSLHDPQNAGKSMGYGQAAHLAGPIQFTAPPKAGHAIATNKINKETYARIHGDWQDTHPEEVYKRAQELMNNPEWAQVGMNPFRHSYFYDKADMAPVTGAEEVLQVGPLVLAKKPVKAHPDDPQFRLNPKDPNSPTFKKGGKAKKK